MNRDEPKTVGQRPRSVLMKKVLLTTAALAVLTVPAMAAEEPQEEACRSGNKLLEAQQRLAKFYNEWWARSGADVRWQIDQATYNVQATLAWQAENCRESPVTPPGAKQQQQQPK